RIHGAFCKVGGSGSLKSRSEELRPSSGFETTVIGQPERSRRCGAFQVKAQIASRKPVSVNPLVIPVSPEDATKVQQRSPYPQETTELGDTSVVSFPKPLVRRKTKIVCTIGPSTNTKEMIWKLAEAGMNVARLNMSHGDHASHQKVIDLVKEYNSQAKDNVISIMLDTKGPEVRSGDLPQPITLETGQEFTFTIRRGVGTHDCVSVNYDDFVNDVE
ncbi:pyruvate kinase, partial [Genlisea aurea]